VEKVNPNLVGRDDEEQPYTVRYEAVNAMSLNEFLKEHRKVQAQNRRIQKQEAIIAELKKDFSNNRCATAEELDSKIARQQEQIEALGAGMQRVSEELAVEKRAPQLVLNN
jgi:hypothetical protein